MKRLFQLLTLLAAGSAFAQGNLVRTVSTVADAVTLNPRSIQRTVQVLGYGSAGDGGGGMFVVTNTVTSTNTGTRIAMSTAGWSLDRVVNGPEWDARWFGVKADDSTDNTTAINAAVDAVNAAGGGVLNFPAGTTRWHSQAVWKNNVFPRGAGRGVTILDGQHGSGNGGTIRGMGTLASLPTIGANVAAGAQTVTFASDPGLAVGDWWILHNTTDSSYSAARAEYEEGAHFVVLGINGNTVTNYSRSPAAFTTGTNILCWKVNAINTGASDMTIQFKRGMSDYGMIISNGRNPVLKNVAMYGSPIGMASFDRCLNPVGDGVVIDDDQANNGYNYGLQFANSKGGRVVNSRIFTTRHGVAFGGGNSAGAVPCRDAEIANSTIGSNGGDVGLDFHGNVEGITVTGCTLPNGVQFGGDRVTITGNTIGNANNSGYAIAAAEPLGLNATISGNIITAGRDFNGGLVSLGLKSYSTRPSGLKLDNAIYMGSFGHASRPTNETYGYYIYTTGTPGTDDLTVNVAGTVDSQLGTGPVYGLYVTAQEAYGIRNINVDGLTATRCGIRMVTPNFKTAKIRARILDAPAYGLRIGVSMTSPTWTAPQWDLAGTTIIGSQSNGVFATFVPGAFVDLSGMRVIDCAVGPLSGSAGALVSITGGRVVRAVNTANGSTATSPTQTYNNYFATIGTLHEVGTVNIGDGINSLASSYNSVTNRIKLNNTATNMVMSAPMTVDKLGVNGAVPTTGLTVAGAGSVVVVGDSVDQTAAIAVSGSRALFSYNSTSGSAKITTPAKPITLDNGTHTVTLNTSGELLLTGTKWARGTGSPEGVVTAPIGSYYSRTDGGAGTTWYVKESGSGNTGWVAK